MLAENYVQSEKAQADACASILPLARMLHPCQVLISNLVAVLGNDAISFENRN
jgi:hypothetical protein